MMDGSSLSVPQGNHFLRRHVPRYSTCRCAKRVQVLRRSRKPWETTFVSCIDQQRLACFAPKAQGSTVGSGITCPKTVNGWGKGEVRSKLLAGS